MKVKRYVAEPVKVGEILRDLDKNRPYHVLEIAPNHWGDGATGYRLAKWSWGQLLPDFWVRPEELESIYRRRGDDPMFPA